MVLIYQGQSMKDSLEIAGLEDFGFLDVDENIG
jgi:hypothetical protein